MVKAISLPSAVIVALRAWISSIALILFVILTKRKIDRETFKSYVLPMSMCGIFMAIDWIGLFEAYNYTTVAISTVCYYMQPIMVVIGSALLLKEKFTIKHVICAITAFIGMFFVSGVLSGKAPTVAELKGIGFALLGAVSYAAIVLTNKKNPQGDPVVKTAIQLFVAAILTTPYILLSYDVTTLSIDLKGIILLLILGIFITAIPYIIFFNTITKIPARTVAIFSYADPVVAVLLSIFVMGEPMTVFGLIGSVLIIGAALVSELKN
ncbi:MAG: EamA family transporter [Eubacteriales bacterium]|nr:EamA family transporter [Eubacteriales bacterium]